MFALLRSPASRPGTTSLAPMPAAATTARRIGKATLRVIMFPVRFYEARARFAEVARLTDHELADIGLARSDVSDVSALPRDVDPTGELARRAETRRRRR
jgi:uncharacterized protein YjiS (DUF1127 family)